MGRFKNILPIHIKLVIYNTYVLPHFIYCSSIWHFCLKHDCSKLENLNHRFLKFIFNDKADYEILLSRAGTTTLEVRRIQDICILIFKILKHLAPSYLNPLLTLRNNTKNLRGHNKLVVPKVNSTTFGAKTWNNLPDKLRTIDSIYEFKNEIRKINSF